MTIYDEKRLTQTTLKLDIDGLRNGDYSDKYFANIATILTALRETNYSFAGNSPRNLQFDPAVIPIGDIVVEAQIFNRRAPYALVAGVDAALTMIRHCAGHFEGDSYQETWRDLEVVAVDDGVITNYGGDPNVVETVIEIRGRYSDFTLLETPILGVLTRASRIATNVYDVLQAANGKQVLFFPARFDLPQTQSIDGYAYWVAVQRYNHEFKQQMPPLVSTDAQAAWWGGRGGGTVPHAIIACFFADTTEAMLAFARHIPVEVPRIALVDFNNDTVNASLETLAAFWREYSVALKSGDETAQKRWTLNGVRLDTSGNMLDKSLTDEADKGVSAALVHTVRRALDNAWSSWDVPSNLEDEAKAYCRNVQIVVSGGFNAERIARFERDGVPADVYGVGSTFLNNSGSTNTDFTMDVVRLHVNGEWVDMAKVGRRPCDNRDLHPVDLSVF
jgi:nicotinate phosphoribosyltransferase